MHDTAPQNLHENAAFSLGLVTDTAAIADLPARERILATAHRLFYRDGLRATGVDRLIAESGVAKLTFYRHFAAKDDLLRLYLEDRHGRWIAWLSDALKHHESASPARFGPLLAAMREWFEAPVFRGCAFINAVAEVADSLPGAMEISRRHKADMVKVIARLLPADERQLGTAQAAAVAVDGAIVQAQLNGGEAAIRSLGLLLAALENATP
ncbi:MAG: TetR/AcrR family transcriptional regulator [Comamonadaceae bacterium]|nr:MAG: TetR/AcrR family transcriptional regulator [Comamonadaceae bacterium]